MERRALLDAAAAILAREGPGALTLRRVTAAVGASTTVAYTLFGGKPGLVRALHDAAFEQLADTMAAAPAARDPLVALAHLARAYRKNALARPAFHQLLAGAALVGDGALSAADVRATRAYGLMRAAVEACLRARRFAPARPEAIADGLWACVHGLVGLELAGYFPSRGAAEHCFERTIAACARGFSAAERP